MSNKIFFKAIYGDLPKSALSYYKWTSYPGFRLVGPKLTDQGNKASIKEIYIR